MVRSIARVKGDRLGACPVTAGDAWREQCQHVGGGGSEAVAPRRWLRSGGSEAVAPTGAKVLSDRSEGGSDKSEGAAGVCSPVAQPILVKEQVRITDAVRVRIHGV